MKIDQETATKVVDAALEAGITHFDTAEALSWLAMQPSVATVLVGATSPEQVTANAAALCTLPQDLFDAVGEAAATR